MKDGDGGGAGGGVVEETDVEKEQGHERRGVVRAMIETVVDMNR